ncbi:hypothetical protein Nepgr_020361 [Nepenthes gracilis]|uniref:Uncharacterized protein n=1 Tax=Nepenthes gracilis TaxID=150966 RepID=A0AAD3SWQ3_NEPGR|nr:hypothetical protein Nepgr_020361 [Nepenthes gracilis]
MPWLTSLVRGQAEESVVALLIAMMLILLEMMRQRAVSNLSLRSLDDGISRMRGEHALASGANLRSGTRNDGQSALLLVAEPLVAAAVGASIGLLKLWNVWLNCDILLVQQVLNVPCPSLFGGESYHAVFTCCGPAGCTCCCRSSAFSLQLGVAVLMPTGCAERQLLY